MFVAALARPRAALLVALLALAALAAAVLTIPPPASAAPPDDLALTLSLIEDSDNIVPPGGTLQVRATLTHTQDETGRSNVPDDLIVNSGTLRVTGDQEWDASGRSLLMLRSGQVFASPLWGSRTGFSVAVMERSAAEGGDVAVLGAYLDTVNGQYQAGSANLFVDGKFVNRLTGTPNTGSRYYQTGQTAEGTAIDPPFARSSFGEDLDVGGDATTGGPWIVVGAPDEEYALNGTTANFGAVYIFDVDGNLRSKITMAEVPGCSNGTSRVRRFGHSVAISDDGSTIVVGQEPSHQHHCTTEASNFKEYLATGFVFTVGSDGWGPDGVGTVTMRNTIDDAATDLYYSAASSHYTGTEPGAFTVGLSPGNLYSVSTSTIAGQRGKAFGDVDISGDGKVIAIGAFVAPSVMGMQHVDGWYYSHNGARGGVMVFDEPDDGWSGMTGNVEETAFLTDLGDRKKLRIGRELAISRDGAVIAAIATGEYSEAVHAVNGWPGSVMVWQEPGSGWADTQSKTADLTNPSAVNGRHFGHQVAVSDSGSRIAVADPYKPDNDFADGELHIFDRSGATWVSDSTPDRVLTSPESRNRLYFGRPALDGENTLLVGQMERSGYTTGHGRGYAFDLSDLTDPGTLLDDCTHSTLDGTTTWTCDVGTIGGTEIVIPAGTPEGTFTISASLKIDNGDDPDITVTDTLEVTIGTVNEADHVEFDFAFNPGDLTKTGDRDEGPYPSAIPAGDSTRLQLRILNSGNQPAGANAVSAVLFTTNMGSLRLLSPAGAATGTCALTCQVNVSKLNASNSGNIVVELTHPGAGKSGTATVRAQVLPRTGGGQLPVDAVTVTLSGTAAKLAISEAATGVLNVNTATGDDDAAETRDRLRFSVSATDASGNKANVPANPRTTLIKGPDGAVVWRSSDANTATFAVAWPLTTEDGDDAGSERDIVLDPDGKLQVELDVNAPAATPLANGEYTLEVTAGTIKATQTFTVSGGPESISFGEPDGELTIGGQFTLTVTLSDAAGAAVPDGTVVSFGLTPTGALPVLVEVRKTPTTTDGQASITYQVISAGRASVRASSGDAGDVALISTSDSTTAAEPAAPVNPADSLSPKMPNDYSSWLGEGTTTASALLDGLSNGIDTILRWYNGEWLRYGLVDGRPIPGALDFEVTRGAILWLGSGG